MASCCFFCSCCLYFILFLLQRYCFQRLLLQFFTSVLLLLLLLLPYFVETPLVGCCLILKIGCRIIYRTINIFFFFCSLLLLFVAKIFMLIMMEKYFHCRVENSRVKLAAKLKKLLNWFDDGSYMLKMVATGDETWLLTVDREPNS